MYPSEHLITDKKEECFIVCRIDGKTKGYVSKRGRIIEAKEERIQEHKTLIDEYEINITISGTMVLTCSITLKDVNYDQ